jgi:aspartokinase-like uncharacterized kinase
MKNVSSIHQACLVHSNIIWAPAINQLSYAAIEASWDVSSDSLAAWLARQLKAQELILVKSADISLANNIYDLQERGVLDNAFADFVKNADYKITVINKYKFNERCYSRALL